jgi:hypothetical protein
MLKLALLLMLLVAACDLPWDGPMLPGGANWISYTMTYGGPADTCGSGPNVVAGTVLAEVQADAIAVCPRAGGCRDSAGCWPGVQEAAGRVYLAMLLPYESCNVTIKDGMAASDTALYFIRWVGRGGGPCPGIAIAIPTFVLYTVRRSDLAVHGWLKIELQIQRAGSQIQVLDTGIELT